MPQGRAVSLEGAGSRYAPVLLGRKTDGTSAVLVRDTAFRFCQALTAPACQQQWGCHCRCTADASTLISTVPAPVAVG
jgi:hypothetical protein